jgi:hypothetical protein
VILQHSLVSGNTNRCDDHPRNEYRIEGKVALLDVSTPSQPNTETKIDLNDLQRVLDVRGRGGRMRWLIHDSSGKGAVWGNYVVASDRKIRLHRFILRLTDSALIADHINGDTLDNRKSNLRVINRRENNKNMRKRLNNTSGYTGVTLTKNNLYSACIELHGVKYYLGEFDGIEQANIAYRAAAKVLGFSERHGK